MRSRICAKEGCWRREWFCSSPVKAKGSCFDGLVMSLKVDHTDSKSKYLLTLTRLKGRKGVQTRISVLEVKIAHGAGRK